MPDFSGLDAATLGVTLFLWREIYALKSLLASELRTIEARLTKLETELEK